MQGEKKRARKKRGIDQARPQRKKGKRGGGSNVKRKRKIESRVEKKVPVWEEKKKPCRNAT